MGPVIASLFIAPALVLFTVVVVVPVAQNLFYSVTNWDGFAPTFHFVGLTNFRDLFVDPAVGNAVKNTLIFTVVNSPVQVVIGLGLALALEGDGRLRRFFRVVFVMPIAISGVALGVLGSIIFAPNSGLLAAIAHIPGFAILGQDWLGNPALAMSSVIALNLWAWSGFTMLIFQAALATVPVELYEAARLDGAGAWGAFRNVTWPLIAPATTVNLLLTVIGGFKIFDIIYILTGGGPGTATTSIVMLVTQEGNFNRFGYSSAMNLVLTLLILVISVALLGFLRRREERMR